MFPLMWEIIATVWFVAPLHLDLMLPLIEMNSTMYNTVKYVIVIFKPSIVPKM